MLKRIKKIVILLALFGIAGSVYFVIVTRQNQEPSGQLSLYGNVDIRQVQLAFHDTGRIEKILVREGDRVKAGDELAEIDSVRYQANLKKARAELAAQKQVVARLESGSRPQEIARFRADVRAMEAKMADAKTTLRRLQQLLKAKGTSRQKVDNATATYTAAAEGLEAARQTLDLAIAGPRREDIAEAGAKMQANEAGVALAEKELADTRIYSPADAVIRDRILEPGDMAFPNIPVLTLALTDPLWIRAYVPESDLGKIRPGMKAEITTDSFPGKIYQGWIGFISPTAEFTPKTVETPALRTRLVYQVRVFACNPQGELRLGMPATVQVDLRQKKPADRMDGQTPCRNR